MKSGLDYFPLDVSLDAKFELIEAEFGLTGFGVVVHLLQEIYGKAGYYIEWTKEVALLFARKLGVGGSVVSEIVEASIRRGMFDREKYDKYRVLTSKGIQRRYFEAVSRRKVLEVDYNILLVDVAQFCRNARIIAKNVNICYENADISEQSKVKESKVKESKVLQEEESVATVMNLYMNCISSFPSPTVLEGIQVYLETMQSDVVCHAISIAAAEGKRNWSYINGILRRYASANIKTMADVLASEAEFEKAKARKKERSTNGNFAKSFNGENAGRQWNIKYDVDGTQV